MTLRCAIASDLHMEFDEALLHGRAPKSGAAAQWCQHLEERRADFRHPRLGPDLYDAMGADLLVLAGDIAVGTAAVGYAAEAAAYCGCPVVLVPGNHEYYGGELTETLRDMRTMAAASRGRVHLLDNDRLDLRFGASRLAILGTTLWTDYALNGADESQIAAALHAAAHGLNDHRRIRFGPRQHAFWPADALNLHQEASHWLEDALPKARADADLVIAVSHHAPSVRCMAPQYHGGSLAPAFASDLEWLIDVADPNLWISGHTHFSHDFALGHTRVVSAQRGYIGSDAGAESFGPVVLPLHR